MMKPIQRHRLVVLLYMLFRILLCDGKIRTYTVHFRRPARHFTVSVLRMLGDICILVIFWGPSSRAGLHAYARMNHRRVSPPLNPHHHLVGASALLHLARAQYALAAGRDALHRFLCSLVGTIQQSTKASLECIITERVNHCADPVSLSMVEDMLSLLPPSRYIK